MLPAQLKGGLEIVLILQAELFGVLGAECLGDRTGPGDVGVCFGLLEAPSFSFVLGMSCSVALWPQRGPVPSVCPRPPWYRTVQPAQCWSPQEAADFRDSRNAFSGPVLRYIAVMHPDILRTPKFYTQFCPVGCVSPSLCATRCPEDAECAQTTWLRALGARLAVPPGVSWRLAEAAESIVVAWQRPQSAQLTWDRTSLLVFPQQKAAVTNRE